MNDIVIAGGSGEFITQLIMRGVNYPVMVMRSEVATDIRPIPNGGRINS